MPVPAATTTSHLAPPAQGYVLGTALVESDYAGVTRLCTELAKVDRCHAVDFTNTHIVTTRRHDAAFRELTQAMDYFVPDGMPLIWCLNRQGAGLKDRVYGPAFLRYSIEHSPAECTHYFLGASQACLDKLLQVVKEARPGLRVAGAHHGYFKADEEQAIVEEINRLAPDFIWVGLGTPKQQEWIARHKGNVRRGVLLAVGFAFDVNAGTKPDAPAWMQRCGLTWLYRMASEPRRLVGRYLKWNSLFLFYLLWDGIRGRAFSPLEAPTPKA